MSWPHPDLYFFLSLLAVGNQPQPRAHVMSFGPAELGQMMEGAQSLFLRATVVSIGLGILIGIIITMCNALTTEKTTHSIKRKQLEDEMGDVILARLNQRRYRSEAIVFVVILMVAIVTSLLMGDKFWGTSCCSLQVFFLFRCPSLHARARAPRARRRDTAGTRNDMEIATGAM